MNSLKNYIDEIDKYKRNLSDIIHIINASTNPLYFSFLVQIYKKFKEIVDKLEYTNKIYADAGTLLGISRYGGFMPWDDDIDLCFMGTTNDYNEFALKVIKECLNNQLNVYVYLCNKNYTYHENYTKGLIVGKHVVNNSKNNKGEINITDIKSESIVFFNVSDYKNYCKFLDNFNINLASEEKFKSGHLKMPWIDIFPMEKIGNKQYKYTRYFGQSLWGNSDDFIPYSENDIMPLKTIDFFGTKLNIPNKFNEYLIKEYNDVDIFDNIIFYPKHGNDVKEKKILVKNDNYICEFVKKYNLYISLFNQKIR